MGEQTVTSTRNCWSGARDKSRRRARHEIHRRVFHREACLDDGPRDTQDDAETIRNILKHVVEGNRSFFSLVRLQEHVWLCNSVIETSHFLNAVDVHRVKLVSWYGNDGVDQFSSYLSEMESFTIMEFAVWLRRYYVVGALLLGGVNPCIRARPRGGCNISSEQQALAELQGVGATTVLPRFFRDRVPLRLQSYVVKRVCDMRRQHEQFAIKDNTITPCCASCRLSQSVSLCFGEPCYHQFCEICFWEELLRGIDEREGDIVVCTVCNVETTPVAKESQPARDARSDRAADAPILRRERSYALFCQLPATAKELKRLPQKKKRVNERHSLVSTWSFAVLPSLGKTQEVRRDKFWSHVENLSYPYVRSCLENGCDVTDRNVYGQTALFIAAWRGDARLVTLLLEYGCDATTRANGGLTALDVAGSLGHEDIVKLLVPLHDDGPCPGDTGSVLKCLDSFEHPLPPLRELIGPDVGHPGSGSFVLDDLISKEAIDTLIGLWQSLPVAVEVSAKKSGKCSIRSYFCDAAETISSLLLTSLRGVQWPGSYMESQCIVVFPHMRFLCYQESGMALAPHVDLARTDPYTGARSTHSFLLYLTDCEAGGETSLLTDLYGGKAGELAPEEFVLAMVKPRRGRLLLFPHSCPHQGEGVIDSPKLLIRGEVKLPLLRV